MRGEGFIRRDGREKGTVAMLLSFFISSLVLMLNVRCLFVWSQDLVASKGGVKADSQGFDIFPSFHRLVGDETAIAQQTSTSDHVACCRN